MCFQRLTPSFLVQQVAFLRGSPVHNPSNDLTVDSEVILTNPDGSMTVKFTGSDIIAV